MGKHIVFDLEQKQKKNTSHASSVDRSPGHDRTPAGLQTASRHSQATRIAILKLASGMELRLSIPDASADSASPAPGTSTPAALSRSKADLESLRSVNSWPQDSHQSALLNQNCCAAWATFMPTKSLFRAGIRPRRRASTITRDQTIQAASVSERKFCRRQLRSAARLFSDYVDADGEAGFFQCNTVSTGAKASPALVCKSPFKRIVIAGRKQPLLPEVPEVK